MTCSLRGHGECFYCDAPVSRHEHDHAPVPKRAGGVATVVICMGCHNLKDRILLDRWPLTLAVLAVQELIDVDAIPYKFPSEEWPAQWDDMTSHARLLWAKWVKINHGGCELNLFHPAQMMT